MNLRLSSASACTPIMAMIESKATVLTSDRGRSLRRDARLYLRTNHEAGASAVDYRTQLKLPTGANNPGTG